MNVLVAIYADLELYPPSLNAVKELAARVEHVHVVQRGLGHACAKLPENVTVTSAISTEGEQEIRAMSVRQKLQSFIRYVRCLRQVRSIENPGLILAYDPLPLMAVRLSGKRQPSCLLWYHNHDKEDKNVNRPYSLGWWAYKTESSAFRHINFFSLPARERLPLFATERLKTAPILLPNYPARQRVGRVNTVRPNDVIRLV